MQPGIANPEGGILASVKQNFRSLAALSRTASTSRVLNLCAVAAKNSEEQDYKDMPFFTTPILNSCVVIKHAVRPHERDMFMNAPYIATKVILPFDRTNLGLGGRSVFVGERGWSDVLRNMSGDGKEFHRDAELMEALDELPSLDPFLLREHLARRGFTIGSSYFDISEADVDRMQRFVGDEIGNLIRLAFQGKAGHEENTARLVELLLTNQPDARLEPLRLTLRLEGDAYKEGIFCWKGFLYYKWVLSMLAERIAAVTEQINQLRPNNSCSNEVAAQIGSYKSRLCRDVEESKKGAMITLAVYDGAFDQLTKNSDPASFRDFLLKSPALFVSLGESVGGISHIVSYWEYRFPKGKPPRAAAEEVLEILQEFEGSFVSVAANSTATTPKDAAA
jgi:hypothetical protein